MELIFHSFFNKKVFYLKIYKKYYIIYIEKNKKGEFLLCGMDIV